MMDVNVLRMTVAMVIYGIFFIIYMFMRVINNQFGFIETMMVFSYFALVTVFVSVLISLAEDRKF